LHLKRCYNVLRSPFKVRKEMPMANAITELWYGNIDPIRISGRSSAEFLQAECRFLQNTEKLEQQLPKWAVTYFKKYVDSANEYTRLASEQAFYDGFCLGMKLAAESFFRTDQSILQETASKKARRLFGKTEQSPYFLINTVCPRRRGAWPVCRSKRRFRRRLRLRRGCSGS